MYGVGISGFVAQGVRDSFVGVGRSVVMCVAKYMVDGLDVVYDRSLVMFRPSVFGGEYLVLLGVRKDSLPNLEIWLQIVMSSLSRSCCGSEL